MRVPPNPKVFLLSPARCDGRRAKALLNPAAEFPLAVQLRSSEGAMLGEVFSFLSGLYFRGKLTYARAFATSETASVIRIITTNRGLLTPEVRVWPRDLDDFACVDLGDAGESFEKPLERDATELRLALGDAAVAILLGSIATNKYVTPLMRVFGERLVFPRDFVGRGDMSRGGLLLRGARSGEELAYVPIAGATLHGKRPAKLPKVQRAVAIDSSAARRVGGIGTAGRVVRSTKT